MIIINKEFFKDSDLDELRRLIDFSSNLVILDKDKAMDNETSKSTYNADMYLAAYYNLDDEQTPLVKSKILENYVELNPYYKELQSFHGIEPAIARESKHLSILKSNSNALNKFEEHLFYECYYESLDYFNNVTKSKAFDFHPQYNNFMMLFLIWSTIQKYLSRKLDTLFDIDVYDERTLKNSFISLGLDYFDGLPINYQRKLLKKVNDLISYKGSTQCFIDIMNIFGEGIVDIHNYYLVKKFVKYVDDSGKERYNPILEFYKTPFLERLDIKSNEFFQFEEIISTDPYWYATKEELLNKEFSYIKTNYISINSSIDIKKNSLEFSYFFNWLETAYSENRLTNLDIFNSKISSKSFNLYHAIIALMVLGLKINGYKDTIVKNIDASNFIYGYNNSDNSVKLDEYIENIKEELELDYQISLYDKNNILAFVNSFNIEKLNSNNYTLQEFLKLLYKNNETRKSLDEFISNTNNHIIVKNFKLIKELETRVSINNTIFKGYETYSEFLRYNSLNLYNFIQIDTSKYENEQELYFAYKEKMSELISSINSQLYNEDLSEAISRNTFMGINNYLEYYIKTLIILFKPYSMQLLNSDNYYDLKDKNEGFHIMDHMDKHLYKGQSDYIGPFDGCQIINTNNGEVIVKC